MISSLPLVKSNTFWKNPQNLKRAPLMPFQFYASPCLYCYSICFHSYFSNPSVVFSNVLWVTKIFIVFSISKTLMTPYFRAKFLCLDLKSFKKIISLHWPCVHTFPKNEAATQPGQPFVSSKKPLLLFTSFDNTSLPVKWSLLSLTLLSKWHKIFLSRTSSFF